MSALTASDRLPTLRPEQAAPCRWTVYDYYRIARLSNGLSPTRPARAARWWQMLPGAPRGTDDRVSSGRPRVLDPQGPSSPPWRDDVALDFPSARSAAERMRQAFLAAEQHSHARETVIAVPRRAVTRATRVPLHLEVPALCATCGGRGEAWGEHCATCDGVGTETARRYVILRVPAGVRHQTCLRYRIDMPHAAAFDLDVRVHVT